MKKMILGLSVLIAVVFVASCTVYAPYMVTSNEIKPATKVGYSTNQISYFGGLIGDGSINTAVKNGGITKIYYVDFIYESGNRITAVYGE